MGSRGVETRGEKQQTVRQMAATIAENEKHMQNDYQQAEQLKEKAKNT